MFSEKVKIRLSKQHSPNFVSRQISPFEIHYIGETGPETWKTLVLFIDISVFT